MTALAPILLLIAGLYAAVGLVVALAFATRGVSRVDHAARDAHPLFRVLIIPGAAALWPVVLRWWARAGPEPGKTSVNRDLRRTHRRAWLFLAIAIPVLLLSALAARPGPAIPPQPIPAAP